MTETEALIIIGVIFIITLIFVFILSEYIHKHTHIPLILVILIGLLFPPFWWLMLFIAFVMSFSHQSDPTDQIKTVQVSN